MVEMMLKGGNPIQCERASISIIISLIATVSLRRRFIGVIGLDKVRIPEIILIDSVGQLAGRARSTLALTHLTIPQIHTHKPNPLKFRQVDTIKCIPFAQMLQCDRVNV